MTCGCGSVFAEDVDMYDPSPELSKFVQSLPKTETHIHLEGSCPFEMIDRAFPGKYPMGHRCGG